MYLDILDKIHRSVCNIVGPDLASRLLSISQRCDVVYLYLFYKYFHGDFSNDLYSHDACF